MRRISHVLVVIGLVLTAVSAHAQQTGTVQFDFRLKDQGTSATKTLTVSPRTGAGAQTVRARGPNRWRGSARIGVGMGNYGDAVDDNCDDLTGDLDLTCQADNGGGTWYVGGDFGAMIVEDLDLSFHGSFMRLPELGVTAGGTFDGIDISATGSGSGNLWTFGGEARYEVTPRFRIFGGAGISPFTFDTTLTLSAFGATETQEQEFSGVGRTLWAGGEWVPSARDPWAIYAEYRHTSLKDDDVNGDEEPFDESFKGFFVGVRWNFGR